MKTDGARGRLYDALQTVQNRWFDTEPHWTDQVRRDFEDKVVEPMSIFTADALRAIDRLTQIFIQAKRECEGEMSLGSLLS